MKRREREREREAARRGERLYHGGPAGLTAGGWILPPNKTEAETEQGNAFSALDRVYLTTNRWLAFLYSGDTSRFTDGAVYEVEPTEPVEVDPQFDGGITFMAPAATIVRVARSGPTAAERKAGERLGNDMTKILCDRDWHLTSSAHESKVNITHAYLEALDLDRFDMDPELVDAVRSFFTLKLDRLEGRLAVDYGAIERLNSP